MKASDYIIPKIHEYACIIIGDEILDGKIKEINLNVIVEHLSPIGYSLKEARIISDDVDNIASVITELRKKYSFVISTGGIGPTHDDRTMEAYAKSFECQLVEHQEMKEFLYRKPRDSEEKILAAQRMSMLPEEIYLIQLDEKWPLLKLHNCYIMPGVPSICKIVVEKLASILPSQKIKYYAECYVQAYEHEFFQWLNSISEQYINRVDFGSYPLDFDDEMRTREGFYSKIALSSYDEESISECYRRTTEFIAQKNWPNKCISYEDVHG